MYIHVNLQWTAVQTNKECISPKGKGGVKLRAHMKNFHLHSLELAPTCARGSRSSKLIEEDDQLDCKHLQITTTTKNYSAKVISKDTFPVALGL